MGNNNSTTCELDSALVVFIVFFFLIILLGGCGGGYYYYNKCNCNEDFTNFELKNGTHSLKGQDNTYNALYTSKYRYTEPPGDVKAMDYAGVGQGTKGEFLPLQGIGAQTYMKNTSPTNQILPSPNKGMIGGQPNYSTKDETTAWIGFNSFPYDPDSQGESNSYLLSGANERTLNPGQRGDLPAPDWWPVVKKDNKGFAVQGSDLLVTCTNPGRNVNTCEEGEKFVRYKNEPEYKKVYHSFN